ncbi:hypothetical protein BHE74_00046550 [Ensete ventricosum]|nr:hypothetical protein BHE74_00046550 [Ensete ventricosum]
MLEWGGQPGSQGLLPGLLGSPCTLVLSFLFFQDPKRKVHKPVKGVLRLEVEKLHTNSVDTDNISEGGSMIIDSSDAETSFGKHHVNGLDGSKSSNSKFIGIDRKDNRINASTPVGEDHPDSSGDDVSFFGQFQAFDFRMMTRNEPFSQLFHYLYVYPLTVSLSRKRNLFIKVEMRKDDADIRKQPLEVCLDEADFVTIGYAVLPLSTHIQ